MKKTFLPAAGLSIGLALAHPEISACATVGKPIVSLRDVK